MRACRPLRHIVSFRRMYSYRVTRNHRERRSTVQAPASVIGLLAAVPRLPMFPGAWSLVRSLLQLSIFRCSNTRE